MAVAAQTMLVCGVMKSGLSIASGSTIHPCSNCGVDVWVAPAGQELLATQPMPIVCLPCGLPELSGGPV